MKIDWSKVQSVEDNLPEAFVRILTREDCKKGFHRYRTVGVDDLNLYEKCKTCGDVLKVSKLLTSTDSVKFWWKRKHKLDLLQPGGKDFKDFTYYYGDPYSQQKD